MPRKSLEDKARLAACKVKKKGIESKRANMEKVRDLIDKFQYCFVFDIRNFRNSLMKDLKTEWPQSRFFAGKIKPTIVALGKHSNDEYRTNLHLLSQSLQIDASGAHRGLFFTNNLPNKVIKWYKNYQITTFAKTGFVATDEFVVKQGILKDFVFSQEYTLRKLGLAVILRNGRLCLDADYTICTRGQPLKPEQCKLLELFNQPQAEFNLNLYSYWSNDDFYTINNKNGEILQITNANNALSKNINNNENVMDQEDTKVDSNNDSVDVHANSFESEMKSSNDVSNLKTNKTNANNNNEDISAFIDDDGDSDSEEQDDDIL